ncbi:unnamed protein product [Sphagnum jensenii]
MCCTIGQIYIDTKRYTDRSCLVAKFDNSSRYGLGVVESSYLDGLNLSEIQMINQNAVNSSAATQLATAKPGYINTKINEVGRDYVFMCDFTVRNPMGEILMQHYFNSFDTEKETSYVIKVDLPDLLFSDEEKDEYNLDAGTLAKLNDYLARIFNYLKKANNKLSKYEVINDIIAFLPFDFELLLLNYAIAGEKFKDMKYIVGKIDHVLKSYNTSPFKENDNVNKIPMAYALYYYFSPKRISISKQSYDKLFDIILNKIIFAQVDPGTQILLKSGTSYNSVVTQETLKSIHKIKSGNLQDSIDDNFNVAKSSKEESITSYVDDESKYFQKLIFKDLISEIKCEYREETNARIYKLLYSNDLPITYGLYFTFKINIEEMVKNKLLLAFIYVNVISNMDSLINSDSQINKQLTYFARVELEHLRAPHDKHPPQRKHPQREKFIMHIIKCVKTINIRNTNISSIYIEERDFKYKKCVIEGITLREALNLKFIKRDYVLTSNFYSVYEIFGVLNYFSASLINLFNIGKDKQVNPKHGASISCVICQNNNLISLNRQGFDKISVGKWANIAFENQSNNLLKSALKNSVDYGKSINSQIIFGQKPKIGTNHATIIYDLNKFKSYNNYKIAEPKENKLYNIVKNNFNEEQN